MKQHFHDWRLDYLVRDGPSAYSPIKLRVYSCACGEQARMNASSEEES